MAEEFLLVPLREVTQVEVECPNCHCRSVFSLADGELERDSCPFGCGSEIWKSWPDIAHKFDGLRTLLLIDYGGMEDRVFLRVRQATAQERKPE